MGTGSLALNLSLSSFTMNTTSMITIDITRSQILVEVIWTKIFSSVYVQREDTVQLHTMYYYIKSWYS